MPLNVMGIDRDRMRGDLGKVMSDLSSRFDYLFGIFLRDLIICDLRTWNGDV